MNRSKEIVIQTRDLSKSYKNVDALKLLNLEVHKNSIFGFLGPNGAGKTTTIKLLLGLIQPTHGDGTVFEHDIVDESIAIRRRIGYLPQEPRFYEYMTAYETLDFTACVRTGHGKREGVSREEARTERQLEEKQDRESGSGEISRVQFLQAQQGSAHSSSQAEPGTVPRKAPPPDQPYPVRQAGRCNPRNQPVHPGLDRILLAVEYAERG